MEIEVKQYYINQWHQHQDISWEKSGCSPIWDNIEEKYKQTETYESVLYEIIIQPTFQKKY